MLAAIAVTQSHPDVVRLHSKLLLPSLFERRASKRIQSCRFSPTDRLFAVVFENDLHVSIWSYENDAIEHGHSAGPSTSPTKARLITVVRHTRHVLEVGWHVGSTTAADPNPKHHLVTRTHDDVVRIWAPLIDEPFAFRTISVARNRSAAGKQRSADKEGTPTLQRRRCEQISERFEQHDRLHTKSLAHHIAQNALHSNSLEKDVIGNSLHSLDETRWQSDEQDGGQDETPHIARHPSIKISASWDVRRVEASSSNDIEASSSRSVEQAEPISPLSTSLDLTIRRSTEAISSSFSNHGEVVEARFAFPVKDGSCLPILEWTTVNDLHSKASIPVLAVVLDHTLYVLAPKRVSRWQPNRWTEVARLEVGKEPGQVSAKIDNVIWLTQNRLMVSQDRQVWLYDDKLSMQTNKATKRSKTVKGLLQTKADEGATLNERVIRQNAPLSDLEAETLYRCIYWGQFATVLRIIERTKRPLGASLDASVWTAADMRFSASPAERRGEVETVDMGAEELQNLVADCKQQIDSSAGEPTQRLLVVLQLAFELRKLSGQLDDNAVRYLALHATRQSNTADQENAAAETNSLSSARSVFGGAKQPPARPPAPQSLVDGFIEEETARLSVWALHSETQEALLQHLQHLYGGSQRMDWGDARRLGIVMWLGSVEMLRQCIESCARAQYTAGNQHDPASCALLYYALGKDKLVLQLWKQAVWHPEHQKMLRFLQQDFTQQRWKAAAQKNAYALLSQRRFEMAATFFLLGECLEDAVNVCVRNLHDVVLAIALCRVWQDETTGQRVLKSLIVDVILPAALQSADVWTIAWATQYLGHRDLSLLALTSADMSPLAERLHSALNVVKTSHVGQSSDSRAIAWDAEAAILLYCNIYSTKDLADGGKTSGSTVRLEHSILQEALHTLRTDGAVGLAAAVASQWRFKEERAFEEPIKPEVAQPPVPEIPQDTPSAAGQAIDEPPTSSFAAAMGVKKTSSAAVASNMDFDLDAWG